MLGIVEAYITEMKKIHLPCLRGNFGKWNYFSTLIPIKDVVEHKRIITVSESGDLYTAKINEILQREIDEKRIDKIKDYLLKSEDRFFSSLIVAIHKGNPEWADFDIERQFRIDQEILEEEETSFIENKLGILTLTGSEELFVLDGQHRLLGIRKAYEENKEIGKDEISVIFIVHNENLKQRTRRLFTVLNRYAEKIKEAEKVILEEDDAAAILTRRLVDEYPMFKEANSLSTSKTFSLPGGDLTKFTTLVCLYQITQLLINYDTLYKNKVIIRPDDITLNILWIDIKLFWDNFFLNFPNTINFIKGKKGLNDEKFNRNKHTGGSLLLRPNGQKLFAEMYQESKHKKTTDIFWKKVVKINFDLNGENWRYVFWDEKIIVKNISLKKSIFRYLLGDKGLEKKVKEEIIKIYKTVNLVYKDEIKPI